MRTYPCDPGTDRFAMQIGYDTQVSGEPQQDFTAQLNGNIAQIKWVNRKFNDTPLYYAFGYDSRDQLVRADNSNNDFNAAYSYDANGNFTAFNEGAAWTYNYKSGTNMLDEVDPLTSANNWGYDAAGRQTRDDGADFSSASFHFPGAAFHDITLTDGTVQMRYNGANRRLKKKATGENGLETDYIRDKDGRVLAVYEDGDLVERYVWGPLGLVKIVKGLNGSTTDYYVLNDHLGYVRVVVDDSGDAVAGYDYFPYGKGMTGRFDNDSIYGSRFKFGAKEFDTDLGLELYYFEARFYNPEIGRFVSPDPLRVGWSHYVFVGGNPVCNIDPTGLVWFYFQETGTLVWFPPNGEDDTLVILNMGYSGKGEGLNNPEMEGVCCKGPIPVGLYEIGPLQSKEGKGNYMDLTKIDGKPYPGNRTGGFQIHGEGTPGDYSASKGCIVLPLWVRFLIADSGDTMLNVM